MTRAPAMTRADPLLLRRRAPARREWSDL